MASFHTLQCNVRDNIISDLLHITGFRRSSAPATRQANLVALRLELFISFTFVTFNFIYDVIAKEFISN